MNNYYTSVEIELAMNFEMQYEIECEEFYLTNNRDLYMECMNYNPLKNRKTPNEMRRGLILFYNVFIKKYKHQIKQGLFAEFKKLILSGKTYKQTCEILVERMKKKILENQIETNVLIGAWNEFFSSVHNAAKEAFYFFE